MNTESEANIGVRDLGWVAENVDGETADGREEELDVSASDELGEGTASNFEKGAAEGSLV